MFTYHARGVKHERDSEGNKLDHIQQITNDSETPEFWSVYRRNPDDPTSTRCIADFFGDDMERNAKDFELLKNDCPAADRIAVLITRINAVKNTWLEVYKVPRAGCKIEGGKRATAIFVNGKKLDSQLAAIQYVHQVFGVAYAKDLKAAFKTQYWPV